MKLNGKRLDFVKLRADGKSYRQIEAEAGISKSTCCEWEKELSEEISHLRKENLSALYEAYGMTREARIRQIGATLQRIDQALAAADLSRMPPEKLLDFRLKYAAALKSEYAAVAVAPTGEADDTLAALRNLYDRTAAGDITTDQARAELAIISGITSGHQRANPFADLMLT